MRKITSMKILGAAIGCALVGLALGCGGGGGGGGDGDGDGALPPPPYRFEWTGTVSDIRDGLNAVATMPDVSVGDTFVATLDYDPATFGDGVDITSDGLDYAAPAGLTMTFQFTSGGVFTKEIRHVRARDGGSFDQWNWEAVDGLLFQANDFTDSSYDLPLPTSFDFMHTLFRNAAALLIPSSGNSLDLFVELPDAEERRIDFGNQLWQVIEN